MSEVERPTPRRVAIAVSGPVQPLLLANLLGQLALGPGDELRGLFIEDSDLLKAAALPFSVEFCALTSVRRPIDRARIEAALRAAAASAERELARLAADVGLAWQFEIVREKRRIAVSAALGTLDALVVTPAGASDVGNAAGRGALVALIDHGEAGARALALARAMARAEGASLTVYPRDGEFADSHGQAMTPAGLAARLRHPAPQLIVLAAPLIESDAHGLLELCEATPAPLVIVR